MNVFRIIALSVLLAGGASLAEGHTDHPANQKKPPKPVIPKAVLTEADRPKTCADQCKVMEKLMTEPCKKSAGTNKQAQEMCGKQAKQMVDACYGSCKEKGRLDKRYIMEHIKPPAGYKGGAAGAQGAEEDSDGH